MSRRILDLGYVKEVLPDNYLLAKPYDLVSAKDRKVTPDPVMLKTGTISV